MTQRVAILTTSYPAFAGDPSGHFVEADARVCAENGGNVTVIAPGPPGVSYSRGVELVRVGGGDLFGWPGVLPRLDENPARALVLPAWAMRARRAVERSGADELMAHWVLPNVWPLALGLTMPASAVSHGTDVRMLLRLPEPFRLRLVQRIVARLDSWRFVSDHLYASLRAGIADAATQRHLDRIATVAGSPITLPDLRAAASELRATITETTMFVIAARLVASKRIDAALRWVAASSQRDRCRLFVLGDGPESVPLRALAERLGVTTTFLGTLGREDALRYIAAADALLHASREEGLSTVVREAEHYETEVIVID